MGLNVDGSPRKTVLSEGASLRGQRRGVSGTPEWQRPRGAVWPPVPGRAEAIRPGEPFLTAGQHRELRSLVGFAQRASSVVVGSGSGELRPRSPGPWKATRAAASGGRRAAGRGGARRGLRAPASRSAMCGLPPPPRIADAQSAGRRARGGFQKGTATDACVAHEAGSGLQHVPFPGGGTRCSCRRMCRCRRDLSDETGVARL